MFHVPLEVTPNTSDVRLIGAVTVWSPIRCRKRGLAEVERLDNWERDDGV